MQKNVILLGTSNNQGNTFTLVNVVAKKLDATVFNLTDCDISPFDYQHKNLNDDFIPLILELLKYDHIIFASPVYWYTMSAQMKVFFDRISDLLGVKKELGRKLRGKFCSVLSTGTSTELERSFAEVLKNSFDYLGMHYQGMLYCSCADKFKLFEHEKDIDNWVKEINTKQ